MTKILGIDTGTNSLGWAIVDKTADNYNLLDKGVNIFQEGVKIEKGIESSKAAERTEHRATRVRYYRIKLRKIRLLRILSDNHLCPPLSQEELSIWRLKKIYPKNELFMQWQRTDDDTEKTPYAYRHKCIHEKLDLSDVTDRYILGRAFYHIIQRRGFLSNRKEQGGEDSGKVKEGISTLTQEMNEAGYEYLGDYFYALYNKGEKIRKHYTARNEHFLSEFKAICEKQDLEKELGSEVVRNIEKAIFDQRPLKSQKGQVGKCVFEKNKTKCPSSHPMYEEFRMLTFINNIKIKTPNDDVLRPLNTGEREKIMPLFFRKSKKQFNFLCFNAYNYSRLIIGKNAYQDYLSCKDNVEKLNTKNPNLHRTLEANGFIVTDENDEQKKYLSSVQERKFSKDVYHIIVNPTMDCNLKCWYCYESHIEKSHMTSEMVAAIILHIKEKITKEPFKKLILSFFGGEPLLQKNIVFSLIESIYELSKTHGFYLATSFTTNGTLIDKDFVAKLSPYEPSFQITLDGWQNIHDKVRKYKVNGNGTYSQILSAIKLIQQDSPKSEILVRINVSNRTLDSLTNIANELAEIKQNNNLKIMVSKVWQVNAEKLDEKKILDFVLQCQTNKIQCSYLATSKYTYGCYADNYNQVVINYDGNIYKCTARTFSSENSYGLITSEGQLEWNEMKLQDRLNLELPYRCQICNFLPACPKPCSQKLLEKGENLPCILNKKYGKENYIIEDFYNFLIESNNEK